MLVQLENEQYFCCKILVKKVLRNYKLPFTIKIIDLARRLESSKNHYIKIRMI